MPEQQESVHAFLGRCARERQSFDEVWAELARPKNKQLLRELAEWAYQHAERRRTREAENEAFSPPEVIQSSAGGLPEFRPAALDVIAGVRANLNTEGFIVDGEWVSWLDATPEQHLARAAALERTAAGYMRTAERHRQVAKQIEEAGASCLRDLT